MSTESDDDKDDTVYLLKLTRKQLRHIASHQAITAFKHHRVTISPVLDIAIIFLINAIILYANSFFIEMSKGMWFIYWSHLLISSASYSFYIYLAAKSPVDKFINQATNDVNSMMLDASIKTEIENIIKETE